MYRTNIRKHCRQLVGLATDEEPTEHDFNEKETDTMADEWYFNQHSTGFLAKKDCQVISFAYCTFCEFKKLTKAYLKFHLEYKHEERLSRTTK